MRLGQGGKFSVDEFRPFRLGGSFSVNNLEGGRLSVDNLAFDGCHPYPHGLYAPGTACEVGVSAQPQPDGWELQRDANGG